MSAIKTAWQNETTGESGEAEVNPKSLVDCNMSPVDFFWPGMDSGHGDMADAMGYARRAACAEGDWEQRDADEIADQLGTLVRIIAIKARLG